MISVIIPVYNRKIELERAVKSVLDQSYDDFELIIINDCSSDKISNKFNDVRIKYLHNDKNMGVSYSRNRGIKEARGKYIALLDSDDEWLPKKLEQQIDFLNNNPNLRVVHTEEIWIRNGVRVNQMKKHQKSGGDIFIPSLKLCLMSPSSIMMHKSIFSDYGLFDETMQVCEDYDLWLKISSNEPVGFIDTPLIKKYGGHDDQLSRKYMAMDKYRVKSLLNILHAIKLTDEKKSALIDTALSKSAILLNGALKRELADEALYYKTIIKELKNQSIPICLQEDGQSSPEI